MRMASASGVPIDPIRRAMNSRMIGIGEDDPSRAARRASTAASGSAAYQSMSGRFESETSSEWPTSPETISQRSSAGRRCAAEARYNRTIGEASLRAISANCASNLRPGGFSSVANWIVQARIAGSGSLSPYSR